MMDWHRMVELIVGATGETLYMVGITTLCAVALGFPLGFILYLTRKGGLSPSTMLYGMLSFCVNIGRSIPFAILIVAVIPLTRCILGTSIGTTAAIVPLALGSIPFYARLIESIFAEVDPSIITSAVMMGSSIPQIIGRVLLPEALPGLIRITFLLIVTIINYSALAGLVGGGGLGALAIQYGYQKFDSSMMLATVVALLILVEVFQWMGILLERKILAQRGINKG